MAEANGDAMAAGFRELREVWVRALERATDLEPAIRADLQKEAISRSEDKPYCFFKASHHFLLSLVSQNFTALTILPLICASF